MQIAVEKSYLMVVILLRVDTEYIARALTWMMISKIV